MVIRKSKLSLSLAHSLGGKGVEKLTGEGTMIQGGPAYAEASAGKLGE